MNLFSIPEIGNCPLSVEGLRRCRQIKGVCGRSWKSRGRVGAEQSLRIV